MSNVLILGSGGREHTLAWKISQSPLLGRLFVAPGNGGTAEIAENIALDPCDFDAIAGICIEKDIHILIPGSEEPLVAGIADYFSERADLSHIFLFGPSKKAAQLEGSKTFAKAFLEEFSIPTADYRSFEPDQIEEAFAFLDRMSPPYVIKADGLAAGKGVIICNERAAANEALNSILLQNKFGRSGSRVVIEAFLQGIEFSVFAMSDGEHFALLPEAKDYKRIGENDTGLNTGGMGAVSPVPFLNAELQNKVLERIVKPTFKGLKFRDMPFTGFLFFGLIEVQGDPFVIEYNVRMGDPETEVVIPRLKNDLLEMLLASSNKRLDKISVVVDPRYCSTVFAVSGGYPEAYSKGVPISMDHATNCQYFHAGTARDEDGVLRSNGGRVIAATALHHNLKEALQESYRGIGQIHFEGMYYRTDIGKDLMQLTKS